MWKRFWQSQPAGVQAGDGGVQIAPGLQEKFTRWTSFRKTWEHKTGLKSSVVLVIMAFFLGRAEILGEISPFALALYAVMLHLRKGMSGKIMIALLIGALTIHNLSHVMSLAVMLLLYLGLHKLLSRRKAFNLNMVPFIVFLMDSGTRIGISLALDDMTRYSLVMGLIEGFLAMVLTLIFIQSLPVFTFKRGAKELRNEEIFCLIILMASVLTGLTGIQLGSMSFENIFSRYLIMLFALIGGAGVGASVGVVTGIILAMASLAAVSQVGMLAFAGLLGGLLKDAKKVGTGLGFLLGTSILAVYVEELPQVLTAAQETISAFLLLLFTPKSFIEQVSRYVPGTHQHYLSQQDYARRVRDLMAGRIKEISSVFQELSRTFSQLSAIGRRSHDEALNKMMNVVAKQVCTSCFKRDQCWDKEFYQTYHAFLETVEVIEREGVVVKENLPESFERKCVRTDQVLPVLYNVSDSIKRDMAWQGRLQESRELVAAQLNGVSGIMQDLTRELQKENHASADHEELIVASLEQLGLSIRSVDIISLEEGKVEIEVTQALSFDMSECEKLIAPLLSEIIGENIVVENKSGNGDGGLTALFRSAKLYHVETAVTSAAKDGKILSGDSYTTLDVGNGKFAVAVSDGMGNGERAMQESSAAIRLLQQLLKAGFEEQLAIRTVNSVLLLRSKDEIFTTLDLALIDQFTAKTEFLKIGSVPSFIKRGRNVTSIKGENVPIGILQDIDIQSVEAELEVGDLLILMSDGIYDSPKHVNDKEDWFKKKIERMDSDDPQAIADMLVELAVRLNHGKIGDDMTVLVAKIERYKPEWATIKIPGLKRIKRGKQNGGAPVPLQGAVEKTTLS
ncbi:stage II sporulation protein E [Effusibacillus lacus]|uniref:Stage II sporulation protein E n=1 Tax=Effusibacillus lacus TaxID=1348429 RepID=A0A292YJJ4_9BACL|nr:stage II sporulation protein E [Effusibacillus lacus]TCS74479.1 stage II sporulation protein E [Effusibacillus lacus]GAX88650.1 stage II sporulation protein E [Effusibacillus lacus]